MKLKTINVIKISEFKDGGTKKYRNAELKEYFVDGRLRSLTRGCIFTGYPGTPGADLVEGVRLFIPATNTIIENPSTKSIKK